MRLQLRIALAIGCVSSLALSLPAFAFPAGAKPQMHRAGEQPKPAPRTQPHKIKQAARDSKKAPRDFKRHRARKIAAACTASRSPSRWRSRAAAGRRWCARRANISAPIPPTARSCGARPFMNFVLRQGRLCRHQFRRRALLRPIRPPHFFAEDRRHRRAHARQGRRPCRRGHRHRSARQSDHHFRQSRRTASARASIPRSRVIAYVMPTESRPLTQVAEHSSPAPSSKVTPQAQTASAIDIDSPITELIAAIEAEQNRTDTQPAAQPAPQPPAPPANRRSASPASGRAADAAPGRAAAASDRGADAASRRRADAAPGRAVDAASHRAADAGPGVAPVDAKVADRVRA